MSSMSMNHLYQTSVPFTYSDDEPNIGLAEVIVTLPPYYTRASAEKVDLSELYS
jgi:hypothetical protein